MTLWKRVGGSWRRFRDSLTIEQIERVILLIFVVSVMILVITPRFSPNIPEVSLGMVSQVDFRSPVRFEFEDRFLFSSSRQQDKQEVKIPVFTVIDGLEREKEEIRNMLDFVENNRTRPDFRMLFYKNFSVPITRSELNFLTNVDMGSFRNLMFSYLWPQIISRGILLDKPSYNNLVSTETVWIYSPANGGYVPRKFSDIVDPSRIENIITDLLRERADPVPLLQQKIYSRILSYYVRENLVYDETRTIEKATERAGHNRESMAAGVRTVVEKGELIIQKNRVVSERDLAMIEAVRKLTRREKYQTILGVAILIGTYLFIIIGYLNKFQPRILNSTLDMVLIGTLIIIILGIAQVVKQAHSIFFIQVAGVRYYVTYYIIPLSAISMIIGMVFSYRLSIIVSIFISIFIGFISGNDLELTFVLMCGAIVSVFSIMNVRRRVDILKGGIYVALIYSVLILAFVLVERRDLGLTLTNLLSAVLNGVFLTPMLVFGLQPFIEGIGNKITPFRLQELDDTNAPVFMEMMEKAPGTYEHSKEVADLAQSAAAAIGANALLCRVGALYHDIGKISRPEFFIENQTGENPHDKLKPRVSAVILSGHVREGLERARKLHLPQPVCDFISQHHGTALMKIFYRMAKDQADEAGFEVDEEGFRYPGPKPQFKETGIVMLADSVEAATRSLKKKSYKNIEDLVRKIINEKFIDGQLNDCDFNLRDLNLIAQAFIEKLPKKYHERIEYPDDEPEKTSQKTPVEREHRKRDEKKKSTGPERSRDHGGKNQGD